MTAASRKPNRRYSRESQQEDRSEAQLKERFADLGLGWPCDRLGRDLGEDLHVRIYDDGQSTGLDFYVQLKSSANAEVLRRKKSPALAYRLETKDLEHWEKQVTLVVLVVWDVEKREGWWRPVPEMIAELDKAGKRWRKKKTATVTVPLANSTSTEGMAALRWLVADHCLPVVPKKDMRFSMAFAKTDQGQEALRTVERALDIGESITLERDFIPKVEFPSWFHRTYGPSGPGDLVKIEIRPTLSKKTRRLRIEIESSEGPAAFSYVELRPTVWGRQRRVLTNEHQKLPLVFSFALDAARSRFEFRRAGLGSTVYEARDAAAFMLAAATGDSVIRVIDLEDGATIVRLEAARANLNYDLSEMRRWRDLLDKLCFIQQRIVGGGTISSDALRNIRASDVEPIESLFQILREGKVERVQSLSYEIAPSDGPLPDVACSVDIGSSDVRCHVLDLDIPLGPVRGSVVESDRYMIAVRAAQAKAKKTRKTVRGQVENLRVIEEYLDWLPGNLPWAAMYEALDNLGDKASPSDGYFTRADARADGASDTIFDALLSENKIEPVASGVYRLVHFPRSDHEELVTLWLQTDRKGVVSHDSALLLHELSDILPARRHITVPAGWDPGDRELESDIELHRGEIAEHEVRWLGPVPYTTPLRTVRDCIDDHLSPDLLDQAITQGLRRRLFKLDDLPPAVRAGAA